MPHAGPGRRAGWGPEQVVSVLEGSVGAARQRAHRPTWGDWCRNSLTGAVRKGQHRWFPACSRTEAGPCPSDQTPDADIKHIASYLFQPDSVLERPSIDSIMTKEQYFRGWTKAKERTSSGTSGLHFGNFKANISCQETLDIDLQLLQICMTKKVLWLI